MITTDPDEPLHQKVHTFLEPRAIIKNQNQEITMEKEMPSFKVLDILKHGAQK